MIPAEVSLVCVVKPDEFWDKKVTHFCFWKEKDRLGFEVSVLKVFCFSGQRAKLWLNCIWHQAWARVHKHLVIKHENICYFSTPKPFIFHFMQWHVWWYLVYWLVKGWDCANVYGHCCISFICTVISQYIYLLSKTAVQEIVPLHKLFKSNIKLVRKIPQNKQVNI